MKLTLLTALLLVPLDEMLADDPASLSMHLQSAADLDELRDLHTNWNEAVLKLSRPAFVIFQ